MKKLTNEEFKIKLAKSNQWVEPIGEYENAKTPLLCRCKMCGREWMAVPNNILNGAKCRPCAIKMQAESMRKTNDTFLEEISIRNPDIEPLEKYVDGKTGILVRCKKCNYTWIARPNNLLSGKGCPKCGIEKTASSKRKTNQLFISELKEKNHNVEALSEYKGINNKIFFRCKNCGHEWSAKPAHVLTGNGCPVCGGSQRKSHEKFLEELKTINPFIEVVDDYKNARTKILCRCLKCHGEWYATPDKLLQGNGCIH